jgi:acyl-CoA dehydrogenase
MPEEFGGVGLGVTDAALMMQTVANSAGAISACSSFHVNLFGPHPLVVYGTEEQTVAVPDVIHGRAVKNKVAVANPEALEFFKNIPDLDR